MAGREERDLFSVKKNKPNKRAEKRKKQFVDDDDEFDTKKLKLFDDEEVPVDLEPLSYQNLPPGLITIGCISRVSKTDLTVSLPYMIYGKVPITRISKAYTALLEKVTESSNAEEADEIFPLQSLFKKGQYVVTKVESNDISEESMPKVNLCLLPEEVNFGIAASKLHKGIVLQCVVASIEDNGYVMETGISNVKVAFLNKTNAEGSGIVGIGSVVWCVITNVRTSDGTISIQLKLNAIPDRVNEAMQDVTETDDLSLLLPGSAISTTISAVEKQCMKVILSESDGVVDPHHLQLPLEQLSSYEIGQKVKARVLYITPLSRVVHLTLQKKIVSERLNENLPDNVNIGDKKKGMVLEVRRKGIYFKIGNYRAFCLRKDLSDTNSSFEHDDLSFPVGSEHELLITAYHYMDETFAVSLATSTLGNQIVAWYALKEGQVIKATIKRYQFNKAIVSVQKNVEGEIPFFHLTDIAVKHPEKKYAVGSIVTARVLEVVPEKKRLILTCKKLLVNSEDTILTEYNKESEGTKVKGFICYISPKGILVKFFGDIKGFVPKSATGIKDGENLFKKFSIGDVVKCKVLTVRPDEEKMSLSLLLDDGKNLERVESNKVFHVGAIVNCSVYGVEQTTIKVRVKPRNVKAELPVCHISDDKDKSEMIKSVLRPGDKIENAVVFRTDQNIYLTTKDSVCMWIWENKCLDFSTLKGNCTYPGIISEVLPSGIKVSLGIGKSSPTIFVNLELQKERQTTESSVNENREINYSPGESIKVKCNGFDDENQPIFTIAKPQKKDKKHHGVQSLYNYLEYQNVLQKNTVRNGLASKEFATIEVGHKLEVDVVHVTSLGLFVKNGDYEIYGIVLNEHLQPGAYYEKGVSVSVCVLHVHVKEKCLVLTAKKKLVNQLYLSESSDIKCGQEIKSEVLLTLKDCAVVRLKSPLKGLIAYLPPKKTLRIGQNIVIIVKYMKKKLILCATRAQNKHETIPVLPILPSFYLQVRDDTCKEYKSKCLHEAMALKKIRRIMSSSQKAKYINEVEANTKVVKHKEIVSNEERLLKKKAIDKKGNKKKKTNVEGEFVKNIIPTVEQFHGNDSDDSGVVENMDSEDKPKKSLKKQKCLKLSTGFVWEVPENDDKEDNISSDSEEDENDESKRKKRKKLTRAEQQLLAKEEEKRLIELESARLEKERLPQSALDYEELLQESPNSSAIWIQFISFHLENAEIERARSIANRALQIIDVQEFEERINIWTVILRLEVLYGTEESLSTVFGEALATNDSLKIYMAMAMVYTESNKIKEAENTYFKMTKKYSQTFDVWVKAGIFFFKKNMLEEGRKYMDRALLSLDKNHHVNLINRFAQLEFQFGEVERARTMFESLLNNYPKRMDMWIVYVDLLAKRGDIEGARQVLERMTSLKLKLRQIRTVFKKFIEFEKIHGTAESVESVKTRVQDYVTASLKE